MPIPPWPISSSTQYSPTRAPRWSGDARDAGAYVDVCVSAIAVPGVSTSVSSSTHPQYNERVASARILSFALCACYQPRAEVACEVGCEPNGPCPADLVCGADLACHAPGTSECTPAACKVAA